jgi:hypothetical protein
MKSKNLNKDKMFFLKKMSQYYSEGNLIVRTDIYDDIELEMFSTIVKEKEKVLKEQEEELFLWKNKVSGRLNSEKNLTKENFPELR